MKAESDKEKQEDKRLNTLQTKGIAHVINDLSNPPRYDFKSLASANFATPAAEAAQWRDFNIEV
jgi:hypothetical protein